MSLDGLDFLSETTDPALPEGENWSEPGYEGKIDYRIRQLSYSGLENLQTCPRKFELARKRANAATETLEAGITFSFGHVVGQGIQEALKDTSFEDFLFKAFITWKPPLFADDTKRKKSFWLALQAVKKFYAIRESILEDYELVYYKGKPSCELSACVSLPNGFRYRLFIDAVLRNKVSEEILVLECKTTAAKVVHPAMYKNSNQGVGYSVIVDKLFPGLSSYQVLYLPYSTTSETFTPFPFFKTSLDRALWLHDLVTSVRIIEIYEENGVYPKNGSSCFKYNKECSYFETCGMSTDYITKPCTEEHQDKTEYDIYVSFEELVESQLEKSA